MQELAYSPSLSMSCSPSSMLLQMAQKSELATVELQHSESESVSLSSVSPLEQPVPRPESDSDLSLPSSDDVDQETDRPGGLTANGRVLELEAKDLCEGILLLAPPPSAVPWLQVTAGAGGRDRCCWWLLDWTRRRGRDEVVFPRLLLVRRGRLDLDDEPPIVIIVYVT